MRRNKGQSNRSPRAAERVGALCVTRDDAWLRHWFLALLSLGFLVALPGITLANAPDPTAHLCDQAAQDAARQSGVPISVLRAITRTETGRARAGALQPWPWTVNMEGAGKWFATEAEARAYVMQHYKRGARSFDVGCFQINYKWHGTQFTSIDAMFDPQENAAYAARFLKSLFAETGDWTKAAGAYHSRTPKYADRYEARFARIRKTVGGPVLPTPTVAAAPIETAAPDISTLNQRINAYPLLQASGGAGRFGSLVPLETSGRPALFVLAAQGS